MDIFIRKHAYTGPVLGVVFDWAGTTVDYGSIGPAAVFVDVFHRFGVEVEISQARMFMGREKMDHIRRMCCLPEIAELWRRAHGKGPEEKDVEAMYAETEPMMAQALKSHSQLMPGLLETVDTLRNKKIKIGACTGYTAPMAAVLVPSAAAQGFVPDVTVCSSDVPAGRPYPWMCFLNALKMEVYPMEAMVKIGDTIADIGEGLNAGMWTIGLTRSGNELGMTREETEHLDPADLEARLDAIASRYLEAGAHYTAEGVWDILPAIEAIENRLAEGQRP